MHNMKRAENLAGNVEKAAFHSTRRQSDEVVDHASEHSSAAYIARRNGKLNDGRFGAERRSTRCLARVPQSRQKSQRPFGRAHFA